jgi:hypothetical protein
LLLALEILHEFVEVGRDASAVTAVGESWKKKTFKSPVSHCLDLG